MKESVTATADIANTYRAQFSNEKYQTDVVGGSSETGLVSDGTSYANWLSTIPANPVFCDYVKGHLLPIWEFAATQARQDAIEAYYVTWAAANGITLSADAVEQAVIGIKVSKSDQGDTISADGLTYYKINQDLNEGTSKHDHSLYFYVAYGDETGTGEAAPITNIAFVLDDDKSDALKDNDSNYALLDVDLNAGAGGDYIALVYTRLTSFKPIRNVRTADASDADTQYPSGFKAVATNGTWTRCTRMRDGKVNSTTVDLNNKSGGDDIYFEVARD